jgi:hypothetical protein
MYPQRRKSIHWNINALLTLIVIVIVSIILNKIIKHSDLIIENLNKLLKEEPILSIDTTNITMEVYATYYNAVAAQCDKSPLITADGSKIDLKKVKDGEIRWLAVSQDLLKRKGGPFRFGDTLYIFHRDPYFKGKWIIHDCMNSRFTKRIDFLIDISNKPNTLSESLLISNKPFYIPRPNNR